MRLNCDDLGDQAGASCDDAEVSVGPDGPEKAKKIKRAADNDPSTGLGGAGFQLSSAAKELALAKAATDRAEAEALKARLKALPCFRDLQARASH